MKYLFLLLFLPTYSLAFTVEQAEKNLIECGITGGLSSMSFDILHKCVQLNSWDECPETGILHYDGSCDNTSIEEFLEEYELVTGE